MAYQGYWNGSGWGAARIVWASKDITSVRQFWASFAPLVTADDAQFTYPANRWHSGKGPANTCLAPI